MITGLTLLGWLGLFTMIVVTVALAVSEHRRSNAR